MHISLLGLYLHDDVKSFYIGRLGYADTDSALLGIHFEDVECEDGECVRMVSMDILYLSLMLNTIESIVSMFKNKKE